MPKTRVVATKQKVMIGQQDNSQLLNKIRKKFSHREDVKDKETGVDLGISSLLEWAESQPTKLDDKGNPIPSEITFWKVHNPKKPNEGLLPSQLDLFVRYMLAGGSIPDSEVRGYTFFVSKPVPKGTHGTITFDQCKMYVSDRFIYTIGTNELLKYELIDVDTIKEYAGLGKKAPVIQTIEDPVKSGDVIHMDIQAAIATYPVVDNNTSYPRPQRKGFKDGVSISKDPSRRYVIIMDVIASVDKVQTVLRDKIGFFKQMISSKPDSKQAQMIKSFQKKAGLDEDMNPKVEDKSENKEDDEVPQLVSVEDTVKDNNNSDETSNRTEINGVIIEDVNDNDDDLDNF